MHRICCSSGTHSPFSSRSGLGHSSTSATQPVVENSQSQVSSNVFIFAVVTEVGVEALRDNRHYKLDATSKMCKSSSQCRKSARLSLRLFLTEIAGKLLACLTW